MGDVPDPREIRDPDELLGIILDPERRGELYPWYHRLRELAPVHRSDGFLTRRAWVLTRFEDVRAALRDPRMRSDDRSLQLFDVGPEGARFQAVMRKMLLYLDPPDHDRIRALVSRHFTPREIEKRRPDVQREVDRLLEGTRERGGLDLVEDFAWPLPIAVICRMMGIPRADVALFQQWAHDFARRGDVSAVDADVIRRGEDASRGFRDYFIALGRERLRSPGDDLVSLLVLARDERGRLTDDELVSTCVILLQAGHETTADLIALGMRGLLLHPEQLARLRADPGRIDDAVEELLRWDSSVQISQRIGAETVEIGGARIPQGDVCVLLGGAANRDPARYRDPDRIDLARPCRDHVAFGLGRYRCLGAALARVEIQTAIATLVRRFPGIAFAGDPVFRGSLYLRGLASLPLRC
jgi:cytochrome P450